MVQITAKIPKDFAKIQLNLHKLGKRAEAEIVPYLHQVSNDIKIEIKRQIDKSPPDPTNSRKVTKSGERHYRSFAGSLLRGFEFF